MAVQWALVLHGLATLVVVVLFLCGQWPIFRRTPIDSICHFLTIGAYDYFLRCVGLPCGVKGTNAILVVNIVGIESVDSGDDTLERHHL